MSSTVFRGRARAARVAALVTVAVAAVGLGASAGASPVVASKATLKVVKLKPFTVRAIGFKPAERVTLTLSGGARGTARGTATATGTLTATFATAKVTACTAYTLRATGSKGSTATYKPTLGLACKPKAIVTFSGTAVVISGTNFKAGEKLTVVFVANEMTHRRAATAGSKGSFSVNLGTLGISECSPYTLTITGSLGSKFTKKQDALPC